MSTELHVTVVDTSGAPIGGALVTLDVTSRPVPEIALVSNAQGEVVMRLPPGRYCLVARASNGATGSQEVTVGSAPQSVVLALG